MPKNRASPRCPLSPSPQPTVLTTGSLKRCRRREPVSEMAAYAFGLEEKCYAELPAYRVRYASCRCTRNLAGEIVKWNYTVHYICMYVYMRTTRISNRERWSEKFLYSRFSSPFPQWVRNANENESSTNIENLRRSQEELTFHQLTSNINFTRTYMKKPTCKLVFETNFGGRVGKIENLPKSS